MHCGTQNMFSQCPDPHCYWLGVSKTDYISHGWYTLELYKIRLNITIRSHIIRTFNQTNATVQMLFPLTSNIMFCNPGKFKVILHSVEYYFKFTWTT